MFWTCLGHVLDMFGTCLGHVWDIPLYPLSAIAGGLGAARPQYCRGSGGGTPPVLQGGLGGGTPPNSKIKKLCARGWYQFFNHRNKIETISYAATVSWVSMVGNHVCRTAGARSPTTRGMGLGLMGGGTAWWPTPLSGPSSLARGKASTAGCCSMPGRGCLSVSCRVSCLTLSRQGLGLWWPWLPPGIVLSGTCRYFSIFSVR